MEEESEGGFAGGELRLAVRRHVGGVMRAQRQWPAAETRVLAKSIAQRKFFSGYKIRPRGLICNTMQHAEHRIILAKNTANGSCGMYAKRLKFAQQKESED